MVCALSAVLLGVGLGLSPGPAAGTAQDTVPAVYPTPQSVELHGERVPLTPSMGLLTGPQSDPAAVRVVRETLQANGVGQIDDGGQLKPGEPAVIVGGPAENPGSAAALAGLGVSDAGSLPAEGYVLADGGSTGAR